MVGSGTNMAGLLMDDVAATRTAGSQTVEKALRLLAVVAEQPASLSLTALSQAAGIEKTTAHRLATSLVRCRFLRFDPATRTYSLGLQLVDLGQQSLAQFDVAREARPFMERLGALTGEAVHLGLFDEGEVVYVAQVPSSEPVIIRAHVGTRGPMHCTAMGKILLAFGPAERMERLLARGAWPAMTPNTIIQSDELAEHLARVRRLGFALDDEEHRLGIRCVGVPVHDHTATAVAALSVTGPAFRLSRERIHEIVGPLLAAAQELSGQLGYRAALPLAAASHTPT